MSDAPPKKLSNLALRLISAFIAIPFLVFLVWYPHPLPLWGLVFVATAAVAVSSPTPGIAISRWLEAGIPVAQAAQWAGNTSEVIWKHYASNTTDYEMPVL